MHKETLGHVYLGWLRKRVSLIEWASTTRVQSTNETHHAFLKELNMYTISCWCKRKIQNHSIKKPGEDYRTSIERLEGLDYFTVNVSSNTPGLRSPICRES